MDYQPTPQGKDPELWMIARRRAGFKSHLATYIVINIFLWLLWYFTGADRNDSGIPWPAWSTFGWGIGLVFHFIGTYLRSNGVEKEYEKLQNKNLK
ncbi:MAG: 2TM domain-containing protein [Flavisolibacter sp.]